MTSSVFFLPFLLAVTFAAAPEESAVSTDASEDNSLIVGGKDVPNGEVPWMVAMSAGRTVRSFVCCASLVSSRHILTAGHCIDTVYTTALSSTLRIHVGSNQWNSGSTEYTIRANLTHPQWDWNTFKNDMGFLITEKSVVFNNLVKPVALNLEPVPNDKSVTVAGWGTLKADGAVPKILQRVSLKTVDSKKCVETIHKFNVDNKVADPREVDPRVELCASGGVGKGTCSGDSGAPLVLAGSRAEQVGIMSWGFPCAAGAPDVFASLSGNKQFVEKSLKVTM